MKYTIMVTRVLLWLTNQNTKTLDAPIPFRPGLKKLVAIRGGCIRGVVWRGSTVNKTELNAHLISSIDFSVTKDRALYRN